ncbi:uncharacterized protein LOC143557777 [Bidens hawaiensis]|uniref:uncharacterized protein LOC143557777 n=1 Tax=Bidens hawaiensis TaxID=980011 RepID=UPI00404B352F
MAEQTSTLPTAPAPIPVFKGEGYKYWSVRMKTILRSRDLWDLVHDGFDAAEKDVGKLKNSQKRDAHAMAIIQQAVHDQLFSRIAAVSTAKDTWEILRMEFQGDSQVKVVKLQGLRREFENLTMKESEVVGDYFGRVMALVSQKRAYGEEISDQTIVEKVLRSLSSRFDYVVPSIEVGHDLSKLTPVKLMGCLQSQEERMNIRSTPEKQNSGDEQALQAMQENNRPFKNSSFRGRGRLSFRGRGRGRSQDRSKVPQYTHCKKIGHERKDCWYLEEQSAANMATDSEDALEDSEQRLFMACIEDQVSLMADDTCNSTPSHLWFLYSGASNHMTGCKESFISLDDSFKMSMRLGDKKILMVEGKGTVKITTPSGSTRLLDDVCLAPHLGYNLLSVGQLMRKGYSLFFDDGKCIIKSKANGRVLMEVPVQSNNMFLLDAANPFREERQR